MIFVVKWETNSKNVENRGRNREMGKFERKKKRGEFASESLRQKTSLRKRFFKDSFLYGVLDFVNFFVI